MNSQKEIDQRNAKLVKDASNAIDQLSEIFKGYIQKRKIARNEAERHGSKYHK